MDVTTTGRSRCARCSPVKPELLSLFQLGADDCSLALPSFYWQQASRQRNSRVEEAAVTDATVVDVMVADGEETDVAGAVLVASIQQKL